MPTGYEVQMYQDITQIRKAMVSIAKSLEKMANPLTVRSWPEICCKPIPHSNPTQVCGKPPNHPEPCGQPTEEN